MNVGQMREALDGLPDDMEITAALGFSSYVWSTLIAEAALLRAHARQALRDRGEDPNKVGKLEGPYKTLNKTGLPMDIQWVSLSDPDFEHNRIAVEF